MPIGQVESDHNFQFALDYCSSFVEDFPRARELEVRLLYKSFLKSAQSKILW